MCQRYFCPAEYITKTKPETNPNPNPLVFLLGLGLVLGFVLVYSAGQKYRWHIFWSRSLWFSAYHLSNVTLAQAFYEVSMVSNQKELESVLVKFVNVNLSKVFYKI